MSPAFVPPPPAPVPADPPPDQPLSAAPVGVPPQQPPMQPQQAFAELGRIVVGSSPLGEVLTRVAGLARACVPGTEEVSVTLIEDGVARTAAFTGQLAASLDERQYADGFGPCLHAASSRQVVRIPDCTAEEVFTGFAEIAARQGVRSIVSAGMDIPQRVAGAINVYCFDNGLLDEDAVALLQMFAEYAAVALVNHALYASAVALSGHLNTAMASREVIDVAKGVLVSRLRCSPEEAFQHLVTRSQDTNRKLRDIAAEIVQHAEQS